MIAANEDIQALELRSRIVLERAEPGPTEEQIADDLQVTPSVVPK